MTAQRERSSRFTTTRARLVLLGLAVVGAGLLLLVPDRQPDEPADAAGASTEQGPLDIELATFDGDPVTLADITDGQPLVVNFFASWCGPCVREMPDFEAVHRRRKGDVRFVGISLQDPPAAAAELVRQTGVSYLVLRDADGDLLRAMRGFSMPTTVFLSAEGEVVEVHGGELSRPALDAQIDRITSRRF